MYWDAYTKDEFQFGSLFLGTKRCKGKQKKLEKKHIKLKNYKMVIIYLPNVLITHILFSLHTIC